MATKTKDQTALDTPAGDTNGDVTAPDPDGKKLFDPAAFQDPLLRIDTVDDHEIEKIAIAVSGTVLLERTDPDHVALYNAMKLGKSANLRVSGRVGGTSAKGNTNREGTLDVVVGTKSVIVDTVWAVAAEDL